MSVPSITKDPGVFSADSMGFIRGLSTLASAFFNAGDGSGNRWLGYAEDACKQSFGDVVPMVD